jgi:hypothetical protein
LLQPQRQRLVVQSGGQQLGRSALAERAVEGMRQPASDFGEDARGVQLAVHSRDIEPVHTHPGPIWMNDGAALERIGCMRLVVDLQRGPLRASVGRRRYAGRPTDRCEVVVFLISPAWTWSKWCLAAFLLATKK